MIIVTHSGVFHADELMAIALVAKVGKGGLINVVDKIVEAPANWLTVLRTFNVPSDLPPGSLVIDIGKEFAPERGRFDHHQDPSLPASNVLVLRHFLPESRFRDILEENLFTPVSDTDRGITKATPTSLNGIMANFNSLGKKGFEMALPIMQHILNAAWETSLKAAEGEEAFMALPSLNGFAFQEAGDFIPGWKDLAKAKGLKGLVTPNARGGWQIVVTDSEVLTLPEEAEGMNFRHASGFMGVFDTFEQAEACTLRM